MIEGLIFALLVLVLFIGGSILGVEANQKSWENDCKVLNIHREGNKVYECHVQTESKKENE